MRPDQIPLADFDRMVADNTGRIGRPLLARCGYAGWEETIFTTRLASPDLIVADNESRVLVVTRDTRNALGQKHYLPR